MSAPEVKPEAGSKTSEERNLEGLLSSEVFSNAHKVLLPVRCRPSITSGMPDTYRHDSNAIPAFA
ncbi:hypothetical protein CE91St62_30250 [Lachnospiraceae bacterium]|nr:hypothetical protein CE91St61_30370 [Lachnospiraceae bacterium]BDF38964.1 hypothetical protein CE91St62_30250 [Lachnospiraceae bacterium]